MPFRPSRSGSPILGVAGRGFGAECFASADLVIVWWAVGSIW